MMDDLISRKAAIEAVGYYSLHSGDKLLFADKPLKDLPTAHPEFDEWCTDCKEYDHERHCCPRYNRIIREALAEIQEAPSAQPEADKVARDIATIIENEKDMRVIQKNAEQRWIPCSERMPEEYGDYLATMDDGDVQECSYSPEKNKPFLRGGWCSYDADGITFLDIAEVIAWMPLPGPWEGEKEE